MARHSEVEFETAVLAHGGIHVNDLQPRTVPYLEVQHELAREI